MPISRKRFLEGACCTTAGTALGFLGRGLIDPGPLPGYAPPLRPIAPRPAAVAEPNEFRNGPGHESYSQAGEDLAVRFFFEYRGIGAMTYLDIGANHPIELNNTYLFYRQAFRGVLIEPNPAYADLLRAVRPGDKTLLAGIGVTAAREAEFYVMSAPTLSTFSKEQAERARAALGKTLRIEEVIKVPLLDINAVMDEHFQGAPTFVSIDTEGMDLAILKTIDFKRFRPKVICAETVESGTTTMIADIPAFLTAHGYVVRGGSFVNTIFVDTKAL